MTQKFKNDARALLATSIGSSDTTILVPAGYGDRFPVANMGAGIVGDWFKVTLEDALGQKEIVHVRTRTAGTDILSDVLRGQDGTAARAWTAGSGATATVVALRLTAADVEQSLAQDWASIPAVSISPASSYKTLTVASRGKHLMTDGSGIMIPSSTFSAGDVIVVYNNDIVNQKLTPSAGVTLQGPGRTTGERQLEPTGLCTIFCVTPTLFRVVGDGVI
jgi:hypothetical protein